MTTTQPQSGARCGATPADQRAPLSRQITDAGRIYADICELRRNRDELAICKPQDLIECGFNAVLVLDRNLWTRIVEEGEAVINARWRARNGFTPPPRPPPCDVE